MTCIGLCCLALVIWTILVTGGFPFIMGEEAVADGGVMPLGLDGEPQPTMATLRPMELCPLNSSLPMDQLKFGLSVQPPNVTAAVKQKHIVTADSEPMCKCLCHYNVTNADILE